MHRQLALLLLPFAAALNTFAAPATNSSIVDLNTPREFPAIKTSEEWQERTRTIREQILVSAGLWPMPEKTPLKAKIFGKIERDGYSIEKVYFQTYPGFYLAGNLYRPLGHGNGPFPAILNPHGHWENGRFANNKDGSIPGRCINFAKQGMIAFSYDMVGYNDTYFADSRTNLPLYKRHRDFETNNPTALLWSINLMGLQTWNSIRALDFLESLPDADKHRLAITGESGGGTQTFMLGAIDDRLAAQAPVVMVSHSMQGGCLCENMPGLRVEFSNMEIAAAAAPRPQIMVGASGDWTKTMMTLEGPSVAHIYDLLHAPENLRYVRFDFPHNYNQTSREAVYQWFDKVLLKQPDEPVKEASFKKEPDEDLRVFPDGKLPPDAIGQQDLVKNLIKMHQAQLKKLQPGDQKSLNTYKKSMEAALRRTLHLNPPSANTFKNVNGFASGTTISKQGYILEKQNIFSQGKENALTLLHFSLTRTNTLKRPFIVVLVAPEGSSVFCDESHNPKGLALKFLDEDFDVAVVESFPEKENQDQTSIFFNTYNRTTLQDRVGELAAVPEGVRRFHMEGGGLPRVILCGTGRAGLWCLLAAPYADEVVADCNTLDISDDQNLVASDLFCPGLRNIDTFNGALITAAPHRLLMHNLGEHFPTDRIASTYKILKASNEFRTEKDKLADDEIVASFIKKM